MVLPHGERTVSIISKSNNTPKLLSSNLKVCKVRYFICRIAQTAQQVGSKRLPVGPTWIAINFNGSDNTRNSKADVSVVSATYFLNCVPIFYKIPSIDRGNHNINNLLPLRCNVSRFATSILYVPSVNHITRGSQKVRFPILLPPNNFT